MVVNTVVSSLSSTNPHNGEAGKLRTALPQFLACMAQNLLLFDLGLALGFSTVVIPALRGLQNDRNPNETLHFTAEQSSWFGSLIFLTQPLASIMSGWITEQIGRKRAMLLANVPHIFAWSILGFANSIELVFFAGVLLSWGVGLMESSIITYVGEISHPSIRGILLSLSNIGVMLGAFSMYVLGSLTTWRNAALISLSLPIITTVALILIPETPHWLLAQKRPKDALSSLQWLRGWVSPQAVATEFRDIETYIKQASVCDPCRKALMPDCSHDSSYLTKIKDLLRPKALRPFLMLSSCFVVVMLNGNSAIRPFLVQFASTLRMPLDPNWATVIVGTMEILSNIVVMLFVKRLGKRKFFLISCMASVLICLGISGNAYVFVAPGVSSFDESLLVDGPNDNWSGLVLVVALAFFGSMAMSIPWCMISEVYPFRVRGTISGISAAFSYITIFAGIKSYINLERNLSISGTFLLYAVLTSFGFVLQYCILPETEGKTLEEIEAYFSDKTRRITDRHIRSIAAEDPTTSRQRHQSTTTPTTYATSL